MDFKMRAEVPPKMIVLEAKFVLRLLRMRELRLGFFGNSGRVFYGKFLLLLVHGIGVNKKQVVTGY